SLANIFADVMRFAQPSVRAADQPAPIGGLPVGASHLGGLPDLPAGTEWPSYQGKPMSFVAQINLADAAPADAAQLLPSAGMLWFFYDAAQQTYGDDPDSRGGWQVITSVSGPAGLSRIDSPPDLPAGSRFQPTGLSFARELTFPPAPQQADPPPGWPADTAQRYENWLFDRFTPAERAQPHHRLLGWPDQIQDDMQLQCALVSRGFRSGDAPGAAQAAQSRGDWLLLLQVDSDAAAGMHWGSAGRLYYWIEKAALAARQFDKTWLVMQSD
ncbi:MAG TPA: YwqG family protein, partial [Anaerolineaceae bacterium]